MGWWECRVAGVSFADPDGTKRHRLKTAADQRGLLGHVGARDTHLSGERLPVVLVRNPMNVADGNAVEVHVPAVGDDGMIGHLPRLVACEVAPLLDGQVRVHADVVAVWVHPDHPENPGVQIEVWS